VVDVGQIEAPLDAIAGAVEPSNLTSIGWIQHYH